MNFPCSQLMILTLMKAVSSMLARMNITCQPLNLSGPSLIVAGPGRDAERLLYFA